MVERLFKLFGLDWHQFKTLLVISIRMDFRAQRVSAEQHPKRSPIFRVLILYGLMGVSLASNLAPRVSLSLFSFLMLTYSMIMIMFAVILDFGNIIIYTDDADILLHRPISSRTYFLARYGNFLFYILLMSVASCFFPSFIGLLIQNATWIFPFAFLSVAIIANITAASFIIWIYTGLLNVLKYERFKDIIVYIQIGFAFVIFFTSQLITRVRSETMTNSFELFAERLYFIPSVWYVGLIQMLTGSDDQSVQHTAFIGLAVTGILIFLSFRKISLRYAQHISDMQTDSESLSVQSKKKTSASKAGFFSNWIKKVLQHSESVAAFDLTSHMIKHDRFVKMGIYFVFGIPFALMAFAAIEKRVIDPFAMRSVSEWSSPSSMVVFLIFLMIYSFIMSMIWSRDWEASWLYRIAPLESPGRLYRGVRLAILFYLVLPFFILFGIIYCIQIPWIHGIQYTLSLFLLALNCFSCCMFIVKDYPFSIKREKGEGVQRYSFLIFMIPLFGLNLLVQHIAYRGDLTWWIIQFGLLVVFIVLEIISEKKVNRRLKYGAMLSS